MKKKILAGVIAFLFVGLTFSSGCLDDEDKVSGDVVYLPPSDMPNTSVQQSEIEKSKINFDALKEDPDYYNRQITLNEYNNTIIFKIMGETFILTQAEFSALSPTPHKATTTPQVKRIQALLEEAEEYKSRFYR